MFNVMIVEDSKPIARNIKQQVEAVHPQLRVTAVCYNGLDAIAELQRQPIDLVITDIRMPRMDGLALIEEARNLNPDLVFLILSGYSDFNYARQALRLGVTEYLLKPLDTNELSLALDRIFDKLYATFLQKLAEDISEFVMLGNPDGFITLPAHWRRYCMAVARSGYFKFGNIALDRDKIEPFCAECFPDTEYIIAASTGDAEKIIILACDELSGLDQRMLRFHERLQTSHRPAYLAVGPVETQPERMNSLYKRLTRFLDQNVKPGLPQCWFVETQDNPDAQQPDAIEERAKNNCLAFVRNNRAEALQEELHRLVSHWEEHQFSVYRIKIWLYELFREIFSVFHHDMVDELLAISESYRDIGQQVTQELMSAMKREEPRTELIRSIEQFFQSNLHRQISMKELCGVLNYSPTYIIRVVKQSHGMTPIEYFNKLKMDEARKMLDSGGSIKIRDIADALGFSNQHYFSKVFKQYVGCNPSEYRASK